MITPPMRGLLYQHSARNVWRAHARYSAWCGIVERCFVCRVELHAVLCAQAAEAEERSPKKRKAGAAGSAPEEVWLCVRGIDFAVLVQSCAGVRHLLSARGVDCICILNKGMSVSVRAACVHAVVF